MGLIGQIFDRFRQPKQNLASPPKPLSSSHEHTYKVVEDKLVPQVESLEEFHQQYQVEFEAQDTLRTMKHAESLLNEDQSSIDRDNRKGYIQLKDQPSVTNFVATPDTTFKFHSGEIKLEGHGRTIQSTQLPDTSRLFDQEALWNKDEQSLSFSYTTNEDTQPRARAQNVVSRATFPADSTGRAESAVQSTDNGLLQRTNNILQSVEMWQEVAQLNDQTAQDLNPKAGSSVIPNFHINSMSKSDLEKENALILSGFQTFGISGDDSSLMVAGANEDGGQAFGATLSRRTTAQGVEVELDRPEIGTLEKITWDTSQGIIAYEKSKKG